MAHVGFCILGTKSQAGEIKLTLAEDGLELGKGVGNHWNWGSGPLLTLVAKMLGEGATQGCSHAMGITVPALHVQDRLLVLQSLQKVSQRLGKVVVAIFCMLL